MTLETQAVVKPQRLIRWWLITIALFVSAGLMAAGVLLPRLYEHVLEEHFDFYDRLYPVDDEDFYLIDTFSRAVVFCDGDSDCPKGLSCVKFSRRGPKICEIKCLNTSWDCPEAMACTIESHGRDAATCQPQRYLKEMPDHDE